MSLKNGSKTWSITGRLTTHYAISAFLILNVAIGILYWGLTSTLEKQGNRYLKDEINIIRNILTLPDSLTILEQKFEVGYAAREFMKTYGRLLDRKGRVLAETYQMSAIVPVGAFPTPADDFPQARGVHWKDKRGNTYLLRSVSLPVGNGDSQRFIFQVALETTYLGRILEDYREVLILTLVIGTMVSAGLGAVIVMKGMRPITELTERTRKITSSNLEERIAMAHWPGEMIDLASAFDEMLDRLRNSFERLSGYVSNMAHELRTPINVLLGEAEVALSQQRDPEEYHRVIESNMEELQRLSRTIDALLFIARSDMKEAPLVLEEIDPRQEIGRLIEYYLPMFEDKEVSVSCSGNVMMQADRALLRRAVGNLIANALHYSLHGGRIAADVRKTENGSVEISISDTGYGIGDEDLPKIFDRFFRADATKSFHPQGSGLGLSIVKSIMDLHGGSVSIQSKLSRGTTVTLTFPQKQKDRKPTEP